MYATPNPLWDDVLPWRNLSAAHDGPYTNADLWRLFDPTRLDSALPYVYEHFEWPHCEEEGYPRTLLNATNSQARSTPYVGHPV